MVFSVIHTDEEGSTIMVFKTDREDLSAEVPTPQNFGRLMERMGIVELISIEKVEL